MFRAKSILWIIFAFCVTTGSCADFVQKVGGEVKMDCTDANPNSEIHWKFNSALLIFQSKTGSTRKGNVDVANRARLERTSLKIYSLKSSDFGVYTCGSSTHRLYIASAHANPSSVLYSGKTNLSCDISGAFDGTLMWHRPLKEQSATKKVHLDPVTSDHAGTWTCQINNQKGTELLKIEVVLNVIGPLKTSEEVTISEGGTAELPCFLPATSGLPIMGGSWARDPPSDLIFPALMKIQDGVQWNSTNVNTDKVTTRDQKPNPYFNITLKKVTRADTGVYMCSLEFDGGKSLSAKLSLKVIKRDDDAFDSEGSKVKKNTIWHKRVWGLQCWIWFAIALSTLVLIILVIIILLIYRRNKRMKRKMRRLKSVQQPLTSRDYCKCDRAVRTVRQPGTGKRERPPPLPRHQYSSLNQ